MSDAILPGHDAAEGRLAEASSWDRFRRDPIGLASLAVLGLVAAICFGSLVWSPHPYDAVYPDYVMTPASLTPHPSRAEIDTGLAALAERTRLECALETADGGFVLRLSDDKPIDPRAIHYIERSDMLRVDGQSEASDDGRVLRVPVRLRRETFIFGTDANGRDLFTRVLVAGRVSLAVGALASAVALGIGVVYGAIAGYVGGRTDAVMMRVVDVVYALPFVFLVIVLLTLFGRSLWLIFLAIGAVEWLDMARIVRGQTFTLKRRDFVTAAKALGERDGRILVRHIVPNMIGPVVAYLTLLVPRVILAESFLSFVGLGVQEPLTSWGILVSDGARHVQGAVGLLVFPALALAITVVAANQLGEALLRAGDIGRA